MNLSSEIRQQFEAEVVKAGVQNPRLSSTSRNYDLTIRLYSGEDVLSQAELSHFPGCCGIAILHDCWRNEWVELMFRIREAIAFAGNKGLVVYTDVVGKEPAFLRSLGYRIQTRDFFNPNSGNHVATWAKRIGREKNFEE